MAHTIDYYYALMSGFAYLGEPELRRIAKASGATLNFKPVDIPRVFAEIGTIPPAKQSDAKRAYRSIELQRWAGVRAMPMNAVPRHWPIPLKAASCLVLAAQNLGLDPGPLSSALMRAVYAEERNIADEPTLVQIVTATMPEHAARIMEAAATDQTAALFDAATQDAIAAGVIGSPTYIVDGEMFFGQDRLTFVASRLGVA